MSHILSWIVFIPAIGIPFLWAVPKSKAKWIALIATIVDFFVALPLFIHLTAPLCIIFVYL